MKITQNGKEVKNATVVYSAMTGEPSKVVVKGDIYSASLFEFEDEKDSKKTKPATRKTVKKTGDVMTTKNTGGRKK